MPVVFLYALLLGDCVAAAEGVGLDPQMGFLHALRPGRPALGLDLMEELRSVIAERLGIDADQSSSDQCRTFC